MKLLLDQHISYKLADRLADIFPATSHVRLLHLEKASDSDIWYYARAHDFVLVTKDSDMVDLAIARVGPPKVVWLRLGNVTASRWIPVKDHLNSVAVYNPQTKQLEWSTKLPDGRDLNKLSKDELIRWVEPIIRANSNNKDDQLLKEEIKTRLRRLSSQAH